MVDENGLFTNTNLKLLKCPQAFNKKIYTNPAFILNSSLFLVGLISLTGYFLKKIKPLDVYTNELESQIPEYRIQKETEKKEKEKEIRNKIAEEERKKLKEKEEKVKETRKKLSSQNEKMDIERKKFQQKKKETIKETKRKSKDKRNSNKCEPPKKSIKNDDKKEEDQNAKNKFLKNKNDGNKNPLKKRSVLRSNNNINLVSSNIVSSKDNYKISPRDDKNIINLSPNSFIENNNQDKGLKVFTNKNIINKKKIDNKKKKIDNKKKKTDNINNNFNEKYDKTKCCGSCINQKAKMTLEDILSEPIDEMDYWDIVETDKRSLCEMYRQQIVQTHQISNLFIENRLLGNLPRLFLTILSLDLCFYINGLYYSEDYVSERYQSKEKETFLNIIYRSIVRIFIVSILSWIIECINEFLLPSENDLIKNLKRIIENGDKEGTLTDFGEKQKKYIKIFFVIGIILEVFSLYHMVCVFYHYKYSTTDWITSSLVSFFLFNAVSLLLTFGKVLLRYIALKCKSPKLYNIAEF